MSNGEPIIIKGGGSIEVMLSDDTFPQDPNNVDRHYNADRRITRVEITEAVSGKITSCPIPEDGKFTITIYHSL